MNIRRNGEDGIFLESETARMYIGNNSVGEYVISIAKNATGRREILIPKVIMMDKKDEVIYEAFLEFMKGMFGHSILYREYSSNNISFDEDNKIIRIHSDSNNGAKLNVIFRDRAIILIATKETVKDELTNCDIHCYSECNLRGGYVKYLRELFEKLSALALTQDIEEGKTSLR